LFPANRYYPCQLSHFDQGTNAEIQCRRGHIDLGKRPHWYCEKNSPSHWKQDDTGKHLPGFDGNSACGGVEHGAKLGGLPVPIEKKPHCLKPALQSNIWMGNVWKWNARCYLFQFKERKGLRPWLCTNPPRCSHYPDVNQNHGTLKNLEI